MTLAIPQKRDPFARGLLLVMAGGVVWALCATVTSAVQPAEAQGVIIIQATPTLGLPRQDDPAFAAAMPTPTQALAQSEQPGTWLDQQLAAAAGAADQFAEQQAAALAAEQQAAADHAQYLANVGAQAEHSPRSAPPSPPSYSTGPIALPPEQDGVQIVINPNPAPPAPAIASAVPTISAEQARVLAERDSNGCAVDQVFYPRTGCHTPGSGGPQPGAVGEP